MSRCFDCHERDCICGICQECEEKDEEIYQLKEEIIQLKEEIIQLKEENRMRNTKYNKENVLRIIKILHKGNWTQLEIASYLNDNNIRRSNGALFGQEHVQSRLWALRKRKLIKWRGQGNSPKATTKGKFI